MSQLRICSIAIFTFAGFLLPGALSAGQPVRSCDQIRAQLRQQTQSLKQQQADEMVQCETANGQHNPVCEDLRERQKEELRQLKESTLLQLRGCNTVWEFESPHHFHQVRYYNAIYYPYHHHHHHGHDRDGHDGASAGNRNPHSQVSHEARATHHGSGGSLSASSHAFNGGHVGGSLGHSGGGAAWHGGGVYTGGGSYAGGHTGGYGGSGGGASGSSSGGHSGGSTASNSSASSGSSSSSSSGGGGGHVK